MWRCYTGERTGDEARLAMCDEFTLEDDAEWQALRRISRRCFGLGAVGSAIGLAAASGLGGCAAAGEAPDSTGGPAIAERMVTIATPDGQADAFFAHPHKGRHAAVLVWPDVMGLRDSFKDMTRRLARAGYAALAVNHYYRSAVAPVLPAGSRFTDPAVRAKVQPWGKLLDPAAYARDAGAFIAWLGAQTSVDTRRQIGTVGHCMTGSTAIRTAAAYPRRIGAAASMHGGGLATDAPDSPHRLFATLDAALLIAIAQNDDARDPAAKTRLREACDAAGRACEIEVYPAQLGWTVADSPGFDPPQAQRAWDRLLTLFARL